MGNNGMRNTTAGGSVQSFVVFISGWLGAVALIGCSLTKSPSTESVSNKSSRTAIIRADYKKGDIAKVCQKAYDQFQIELRQSVQNAFELERALADYSDAVSPLTFMGYVHQNQAVREDASQCEEKFNKSMVEVFTRRDLYQKVRESQTKNADEARLVSEMSRQFELNGMSLTDAQLAEFKKLKTELTELETQFAKSMNENKDSVVFTAIELEGVSPSALARFKKTKDGQFIVTTKSTDYVEVMENARNPETRKKLLSAYENREAKANTERLEKAVQLRAKIAQLMGVKHWADYRLNGRMAKNSAEVLKVLTDLKKKLKRRMQKDQAILLQAKKTMGEPDAKKIDAWDIRYYANQVKKRDYSVDQEVLREYFPKDTVMAGMFSIYSTLFGVLFDEISGAEVWAPEVKLYAIRDQATNELLAYFYTDFVPREGKYGHAAAFTLISGRMLPGQIYSKPVSAIVANFTPPAGGKPSLLTHDEVETIFHEFGHIMHQTLTRAPYAYLSGSSTAQDFVEAPSQMLENWVWNEKMLDKLSGHYKDQKKMPPEMVKKLISSRSFNQGNFYSRQLLLGLNDLSMHMANTPVNVTDLYRRLHLEIMGFPAVEDSHFNASFGHLMGGYDAGYYGYIWSEVFAEDMFTAFEKNGLLDPQTGMKYRKSILEKGNMRDPGDLLSEFLGRKPNNSAFLRRLKIN